MVALAQLVAVGAARADSSVPAPPGAPATDGVVRGGVRFRVTAALERGGVRLRATAESADGAEHRMPTQPLVVSGLVSCPVEGHAFGEGGGGSDGWATALAIAPGAAPTVVLNRLVKRELKPFPRGCTIDLTLGLDSVDGRRVEPSLVAVVTWRHQRPRGDELEVRAPRGPRGDRVD